MASRTITLYLVSMGHQNIGECPDCHFDSLEHVKVGIITDSGVRTAERVACPRCRDING